MEDFMAILKNEFEAGESSFLIKLRPQLEWDKAAFNRLTSAMKLCAQSNSSDPKLERRVAEGFWSMSWFVRSWATHTNFPKVHSAEYYESAFARLDDLAYLYFKGYSPYQNETGFEELE